MTHAADGPPLPPVESFPELIRWLADTYHRGRVVHIAYRLQRHPSLIDQWSKGVTKHPSVDSLAAISRAYGLPMPWLLGLIYGAALGLPTPPRASGLAPAAMSDNGAPVKYLRPRRARRKSAPPRGIMSTCWIDALAA
jgi:hypothetical protein